MLLAAASLSLSHPPPVPLSLQFLACGKEAAAFSGRCALRFPTGMHSTDLRGSYEAEVPRAPCCIHSCATPVSKPTARPLSPPCQTLELDPGTYQIVPYTQDPTDNLAYTLSVGATAPVSIDVTPNLAPPPALGSGATPASPGMTLVGAPPTLLRGAWSTSAGTSGGCPNSPDHWTTNPQVGSPLAPSSSICIH